MEEKGTQNKIKIFKQIVTEHRNMKISKEIYKEFDNKSK